MSNPKREEETPSISKLELDCDDIVSDAVFRIPGAITPLNTTGSCEMTPGDSSSNQPTMVRCTLTASDGRGHTVTNSIGGTGVNNTCGRGYYRDQRGVCKPGFPSN